MLIDLGVAISTLIAAIVYLWNATAYPYEDFYKLVSPLHVCTIMFYFNVFMVGFRIEKRMLMTKIINLVILFLIFGFIIAGDLYICFKEGTQDSYATEGFSIAIVAIDSLYAIILIIMNWYNFVSTLALNKKKLARLIFLQIGYIVMSFSQIIPLYMEKQIPLTNDFIFSFWLLFILGEKTDFRYGNSNMDDSESDSDSQRSRTNSNHSVNSQDNNTISPIQKIVQRISAIVFTIATVIGVYIFTVITSIEEDNTIWHTIQDIASITSNIGFYIWTLTTFVKVRNNVIGYDEIV